jgi:hypothetical protein
VCCLSIGQCYLYPFRVKAIPVIGHGGP